MRSLEILLLIGNLPIALRFLFYRRSWPFWFDAVPLVTFLVLLIHASSEGVRWAMSPAYITTLLLFLSSMLPMVRSAPLPESVRSVLGAGSCVCLAISFVLSTAFPVFAVPSPAGDFRVGVTTHLLPGDSGRKILIRIWYPTDESGSSSYLSGAIGTSSRVVAGQLGVPAFLVRHFDLVRTASRVDADLSAVLPRYPVVLHSHDVALGFPEMHTALLQDLASRGYLVVGVNHTGIDTVLNDGLMLSKNESAQMVADAERVLDWLEDLAPTDAQGWLADRVDLGRVAYVGHGAGGEAVYRACGQSVSFNAGVSIGANLVGRSPLPNRPFLFVDPSEKDSSNENDPFAGMVEAAFVLRVADSGAYIFTDIPFWSPLIPTRIDVGPIEPERAHSILSTYVHAFLNVSLNMGVNEPLLERPSSEFPEVSIVVHDVEE